MSLPLAPVTSNRNGLDGPCRESSPNAWMDESSTRFKGRGKKKKDKLTAT